MIRRFRRRRRRILLPIAFAALAVVPAASAGVRLQAADTSGFPAVHVTLLAPVGSHMPALTEDGRPVVGYSAVNLGAEKAIVLALDRSQSMRGRPFASAVAAARAFVGAARAGDHVGLVPFGRSAFASTQLTSSPSQALNALAGLTVDNRSGTALYDAVTIAARSLRGDARRGRAIVVVTDGRDVSSNSTLDDAIAAAHSAHAAVYTIGIGGPSFTPDALRTLSSATGGSYRQARSAADLGSIYTALAAELDRTWQLSFVTAARPGAKLHLAARVPGAGRATMTTTIPGGTAVASGPSGVIPSFAYSFVGTVAVAFACGVLILLACCFWFASRRGGQLRARIEPHLGVVEGGAKVRRARGRAQARVQFADSLERAFGDFRQFRSLQLRIERADLPLRAGELLGLCAGSAFFFGLFAAMLGSSALVILMMMLAFGSVPLGYVSFKAAQRIKQFENQLPDILITIAASLKAGHSFRQGIQSVVDEGSDPAAKEFRRVLTETQLGKPMDDALGDLADRIGSKNLSFVINAVTIQRQIGGSLAGLFDMVADTVRQRQQFMRKVKGLTAMGRMSAYVLVGLPFFIGVVVTLMNPVYMSPLYHSATGQKMIIGGFFLIGIGSLMLKKIVSFKG